MLPFASFATDRTLLPSLEDSPLLDFEADSFFLSTSFGLSFEVLSLFSPFTSLSSLLSFFVSADASAVSVLGLLRFAPLKDLVKDKNQHGKNEWILRIRNNYSILIMASMPTFDRVGNHLHPLNHCIHCLAQFFYLRPVSISFHLDSIYPLHRNHRWSHLRELLLINGKKKLTS